VPGTKTAKASASGISLTTQAIRTSTMLTVMYLATSTIAMKKISA